MSEKDNVLKQSNPKGKSLFGKLLTPLLVVGGLLTAGYFYIFKANVPDTLKEEFVKIPTGSTLESLSKQLYTEGVITDESDFNRWAGWLSFHTVRAGKFKVKPNWSSYDLIKHLQRGEQMTVKVVLNNEKSPFQVAGKMAKVLEADSLALISTFLDAKFLDSIGYSKETLMCLMLPNTYEFYWNTDARKFVERMLKEHKKYWNDTRTAKAKAMNMTPDQVVTMASIVEGESNHADERPKVAAAYLNRLKTNMRLQADPTVQFALMDIEKTASFRRLFYSDYTTQHPYNTYVHDGLPPGPICMPSVSSIDAVLSPDDNKYVFFCGKPDNSGYHNFAETYEQHQVNVKIYQQWLASRK